MTPSRILLVEDDASLRRFVAMALDDLPLELTACENVATALTALAQTSFQLILTDLMMPGESGHGLLDRFQQTPSMQGEAKVVVLSAGLTPEVCLKLQNYNIWRLLHKPVSVTELTTCVSEALTVENTVPTTATASPRAPLIDAEENGKRARSPLNANQIKAITQYFEGDQALFQSYLSACLTQLPADIAAGDKASLAGDLPTLRRISHSLKTVLFTLGIPQLGAQAGTVEDASHSGALQPALAAWAKLRVALHQLNRDFAA